MTLLYCARFCGQGNEHLIRDLFNFDDSMQHSKPFNQSLAGGAPDNKLTKRALLALFTQKKRIFLRKFLKFLPNKRLFDVNVMG